MSDTKAEVKLESGTLIRHRVMGYEGLIDGTTELKTCFTQGGQLLGNVNNKQTFQYRVVVEGRDTRWIAPVEDLEILERVTHVTCSGCQASFRSKPGHANKAGGLCQCGAWICPLCLVCQAATPCAKQGQRLAKKAALKKKAKGG